MLGGVDLSNADVWMSMLVEKTRSNRMGAAIAAAVVVALVFGGIVSWFAAGAPVTVVSDGRAIRVERRSGTVGEILSDAGIVLDPGDVVSADVSSIVKPGSVIVVNRAVPVKVVVDGKTVEALVTGTLVKDALAQSAVTLSSGDIVSAPLDSEVVAGMTIAVTRLTEELVTKKVAIPFQTERHDDPGLEIGISKVIQEGRNGLKEIVVRLLKRGTQVMSSATVSEKVLQRPIPRIVAVGSSGVVSRGGNTIRFKRALEVIATAYTPGPESTGASADGYTSTGLRAGFGIVAVDPRVIPLGSRLYVDGYGFAVAGDVGGAIKGSRIDVCFESKEEALRWGRRKTKVFVL
jgi:uncharacterized protein YabE (DUF348 family)